LTTVTRVLVNARIILVMGVVCPGQSSPPMGPSGEEWIVLHYTFEKA
jgi:hypothetical protein